MSFHHLHNINRKERFFGTVGRFLPTRFKLQLFNHAAEGALTKFQLDIILKKSVCNALRVQNQTAVDEVGSTVPNEIEMIYSHM